MYIVKATKKPLANREIHKSSIHQQLDGLTFALSKKNSKLPQTQTNDNTEKYISIYINQCIKQKLFNREIS